MNNGIEDNELFEKEMDRIRNEFGYEGKSRQWQHGFDSFMRHYMPEIIRLQLEYLLCNNINIKYSNENDEMRLKIEQLRDNIYALEEKVKGLENK